MKNLKIWCVSKKVVFETEVFSAENQQIINSKERDHETYVSIYDQDTHKRCEEAPFFRIIKKDGVWFLHLAGSSSKLYSSFESAKDAAVKFLWKNCKHLINKEENEKKT